VRSFAECSHSSYRFGALKLALRIVKGGVARGFMPIGPSGMRTPQSGEPVPARAIG
jgi:hypothetical protein